MLAPIMREKLMGKAEVRQVFNIPKAGTIAGCFVTEGKITRKAQLRLVRDSVVLYTGKVGSLRRFKDDVPRGRAGLRVRPLRSRATATSRKATSSRPSRSRRWRRRSRTRPAAPEPRGRRSLAAGCEGRSPVTVGIARVTLFLGDSHSLKDKRMVLRKVKDLVRQQVQRVDRGGVGERSLAAGGAGPLAGRAATGASPSRRSTRCCASSAATSQVSNEEKELQSFGDELVGPRLQALGGVSGCAAGGTGRWRGAGDPRRGAGARRDQGPARARRGPDHGDARAGLGRPAHAWALFTVHDARRGGARGVRQGWTTRAATSARRSRGGCG